MKTALKNLFTSKLSKRKSSEKKKIQIPSEPKFQEIIKFAKSAHDKQLRNTKGI